MRKGELITKIYPQILCAVCFALSGCMVGPKYQRPATIADIAQKYIYAGEHIQDVNDPNWIGMWWRRFADATTTELVEQALKNNNELHAAAARVLWAEALLAEAKGGHWPQLTYNFTRSRGKTSFNFGGGRFSNINTTFTQDFSVSYVLDLFGKLKRMERAAWADMLATRANGQALVNVVISNVVKARAEIATLQNSLAIAQANTSNWQKNLEIIERRYNRGLVGPVDVRLARENLAASKAAEITVEMALATAQNSLDVILGRQPGSSGRLPGTLAELPDLSPVPVGLPAALLDRRPDVRAAELTLEAANEQIGVSIAQMFPDLTLTGTVGRSADRWRDIWLHEAEIYSTALKVAAPIFKGGQLKARVEADKARFEELAANYAQTVLTAMREVEDALVREKLRQKRMKHLQLRFTEAVASEKLASERYLRGVERLVTVLEAERRKRIAENELNDIKGKLWSGRVDLFMALGGDWTDNLKEVEN